jgi:transcriptional regulator with XRE-family HTH domain
MKLSMRIRVARQRARLSQEALALNLGVTRSAVVNWECADGVFPASRRLAKLAELTNVSFEWLATGRGVIDHNNHEDSDVPAIEAEMVYDELERRMLDAFRRMTPSARRQAVLQYEIAVPLARSTGSTSR